MANPPPPYDNITGISRAVMKDNAQVSLVNYNGNARPGELVVDLTQDPPPLYVGNNAGQLTLVASGGGGGLPLANGTSNFNIATASSNATITVDGGEIWTFDTTGNLTIPGSIVGQTTIQIDNRTTGNTADIQLYSADDIVLQARDRVLGTDSEGGDINLYAGDGSPDDAGGGSSTGGDIQISGGAGGAGDVSSASLGGFVRLDAGPGGAGSATASAARGGTAYLSGGSGGADNGGGGGGGGDVVITAGDTTNTAQDRGNIVLNAGGGGDETTIGGYVQISIPAVGTNPGGDWTFTGSGITLEPPPNAEIFNPSVGNLTVGTVGNTIVRNIDGVTTYDWIFDNTGNLATPGAIIVESSDSVIKQDGDDLLISHDNEELVLRSVQGDVDLQADSDVILRARSDGAGDYLTKWLATQNNEFTNISGNANVIAELGNLNIQGGRDSLASGNVIITAVDNGVAINTWTFSNTGKMSVPGPIQMAVYANATVRDAAITSPTPGMMIYVTGTGMQVRGATSWNTVTGTGT
jgi:hypothetical protein